MKLSELANIIGGKVEGDGDVGVKSLATLAEAGDTDVSFLANIRYSSQMKETKAAAVIVSNDYPNDHDLTLVRCDDPYFSFRQAMVEFYGFRKHPFEGVSPQANVAHAVELGDDVSIGPFAFISPDVTIGSRSVIYPGAFIGPGCTIGEDCIIYANAMIYDDCVLGDRVTVHSGCAIGVDGFGYATHKCEDGMVRHDKIPPVGNVVLEDDVEIGACCTIQRATMGSTVIGSGTKFADLIGIGHGTKMGSHCLMVSQAGIAGSTNVGHYCVFGGQAGVVGHINIGDNVQIGAQAGVTNDVKSNLELLGAPAMPRAEARRIVMSSVKLPEMRNTVKKLSRDLEKLQKRIDELEAGN